MVGFENRKSGERFKELILEYVFLVCFLAFVTKESYREPFRDALSIIQFQTYWKSFNLAST
jgi:hypothetical protein